MSLRELLVLGTASQVPTRHRNHNGYLLRWDDEGFLFDPGEGTQRQFIHAGVALSAVTRIFVTHFHGDHCLGLASVVQRLSLDRVPQPVEIFFPETGREYYDRLVDSSIYFKQVTLVPRPLPMRGGVVADDGRVRIEAWPLEHAVDTLGYRLVERDEPRFVPERLQALGLAGPAVGQLLRDGAIDHGGRRVTIEEVSAVRPGAVFGFIMDTRRNPNCARLAEDADLLVCESTYLHQDAELAHDNFHMTARQAAEIARDARAKHLVLTHFSQRYEDLTPFVAEAEAVFPAVSVAKDLDRIPFQRPQIVAR